MARLSNVMRFVMAEIEDSLNVTITGSTDISESVARFKVLLPTEKELNIVTNDSEVIKSPELMQELVYKQIMLNWNKLIKK